MSHGRVQFARAMATMRAALCLVLLVGGMSVAPCAPRKQFVLLVAEGICWQDLDGARTPNLKRFISQGAVGLMNCRVLGRQISEAAYLSLGAGSRAVAEQSDEQVGWCGPADDKAVQQLAGTFYSRTGTRLSPKEIGCWAIAAMLRENAAQSYPARPGALGDALRAAGKVAACAGNADIRGQPRRLVAVIAMDSRGIVPLGSVGEGLTRPDDRWPAGIRTNWPGLWRAVSGLLEEADFLAIDLGDTGRLLAAADFLGDDVYRRERKTALERADAFIGELMDALRGREGMLMLVVPSGLPRRAGLREALTPVIMWGRGVRPGLLTSATTRTAGLIANSDVAPTVLQFLGVSIPSDITGRAVQTTARDTFLKVSDVKEFAEDQGALEQIRVLIMHGLAGLMAAAVGFAFCLVLLGERCPRLLAFLARLMLFLALAFVLALLLAGGPHYGNFSRYFHALVLYTALWTIAASVTAAWVGAWPWAAFLWMFAGFMCAMGLAWPGSGLVRDSVLGYSVTLGARYYGLGNEAGGVLLAGAIAWAGRMAEIRRSLAVRVIVSLGLLAVCGAMVWPGLGANLGMGLAAAVGFGVFIRHVWPVESRRRVLVGAVSVVVIGLVAAVAVDLLRGGAGGSHIGRAFQGGIGNILSIAGRKMVRNWVLIEHSPWTWTLALSGIALFFTHLLRPGRTAQIFEDKPILSGVVAGCAAGAAASLAFNDSGVIPAALCLFFAAACVLLEALTPARRAAPHVLQ